MILISAILLFSFGLPYVERSYAQILPPPPPIPIINLPPNASNDSATTKEDTPAKINVLANDSDPNNDALKVASTSTPPNGSVVINSDNTVTYSPNQNFFGTNSFTYTVSDGRGGSDTATVTVVVTAVNDAPVAKADSATTNEDNSVTINVLSNDSDPDSDTLSVVSTSTPSGGTNRINTDNTITYTPNQNFAGTTSFTYTISDGKGESSTATVSITVTPVNDSPVATNDSATTLEDTAVKVSVLANDSDVDSDTLSVTSVSTPSNGVATINLDKTITYTPNQNFAGSDSFTYTISDGKGGSSSATVSITVTPVNDTPVAINDSATTPKGTQVTINVLSNDSDVDSDTLTITSTSIPSSGTASINSGKTITYTPSPSFVGTDSFTYTISDGKGGTDTALVTISITTTNESPIATSDTVERLESYTAQSVVNSLDSARFKQTIKDITDFGSRSQGSQNSTKVLNWLQDQLESMDYDVNRHNFTFNGNLRQSVYATKVGTTNPDQMYIISAHMDTVFEAVGADDNGSGMSLVLEIARALASPGVKTESSVRFIFFNNEETGLAGSTAYVQDRAHLQGIESPPGSGLYPEPTWLGHITHDQILYDHGIPRQPEQNPAADIDIEFRWDAAKAAEGSALAKSIQSANSKYSVRYPAEVGPLMCCSDTWPFRNHTASVTVRENQALEITIHRSSLNDTPADVFSAYSDEDFQLGFDTVRMSAGATAELAGATSPFTIDVLANDSDPDGDTLSVISTSTPSKGITIINADNTITYAPNQVFTGTDSFTYTISDGKGGTDTSTITITITAINDPPAAADDFVSTAEDTPVTINVLANDFDPDGDTIHLESFNATSRFGGTVTRNNNGTPELSDDMLVYTPPTNGFGTDVFSYTISDGNGRSASATVTVVVTSVNDPPTANNDSTQTDTNTKVTINVLANDSDPDADALSIISTTTPANGTATINANNTITYNPNQNFAGPDSFTYTISDGKGGTATASVIVTVFNPQANKPPTATNDSAQTQVNTPVTINVLANDSDQDGDTVLLDSFNTVSQFNGIITRDNNGTPALSDDRLVYTPPAGGFGTDTFSYTISDGNGGFDTATVTVVVTASNNPPQNDPPPDDESGTSSTSHNSLGASSTGLLIPLYVFPIDNTTWQPLLDAKTNHPEVPMIAVINPSNGSGTTTNPQISAHLPRLSAVGIKTIGFIATDWANKTIDNVKLEIDSWKQLYPSVEGIFFDEMSNLPGKEPYYAEIAAYAKSKEGFDLTVGNAGVDTLPSYIGTVDNIVIHENSHLPSHEELSGWHASYDKSNFSILAHTQSQLSGSDVVLISNHVSYLYITDGVLDPGADAHNPYETLSSYIELMAESLDKQAVVMQVESKNLRGVLIKPSNASDSAESLVISSGGVVVRSGPSPLFYRAINATTYEVSAPDFDEYTFSHWENLDASRTRTVTPLQNTTLTAFYNTVPTAASDSATTQEDTPVMISVLANDSDQDGDTVLLDSFNTVSQFNGIVTRDNNGTQALSDDRLVYTPPTNGFGIDTFSYTISDGNGGSDTATVTVIVSSVNDLPIANDDSAQTAINTPVTINVLANDSDIDGFNLSVISTTTPTTGTVVINADNTVTYTPRQDFAGTDAFTYTISDGDGGSDTATVNVTIQ